MKPTHFSLSLLLIACLFGASSLGQAAPAEKGPASPVPAVSNVHTTDDVDVLRETQLQVSTKDHTGLIWWIPFEFWAQSAEKNGNSPEKAREQFKALREYTIVGILVGKFSSLGSVEYVTPSDLQKKTSIRDSEGQDYAALTNLTGDAKNLADMLKPILTNAMGRAGENFALLFFPATKKGGKRIADEASKGSFSVVIKDVAGDGESIYLWRTPLTSFSAPRYCPVGKERVHADWDYCPRHGVKLDQP
jgi:hypothetical protein